MTKTDARKLTPKQQETLRLTAIRMVYDQGYNKRQTAKALGVSRQHVVNWCRKYEKKGIEALKAQLRGRRPGEKRHLKPWQCSVVVRLITDSMPDQLKMPFVLWTRTAIRDLIQQKFGILLSINSVGNYLKRWNMTPQKPVRRAYEKNPKAVQQWLEEDYPVIEQRAKEEGAAIFWADETGLTNEIHNGRSYAPIGQTPVRPEQGKKIKINMISALTNKGEVRFMCYPGKMTQNKYILFLARLIGSSEKKVFLIADNLKVHHGKKVKAWVEEHLDEIELFFLPSYSPELNPDEYLNRDVKKNVHANKVPRSYQELKANLISFMRRLQKLPQRVMSYFNGRHISYASDSCMENV